MSEKDSKIRSKLKTAKRVQLAVVGGVCVAIGFLLSMLTSLFPGLEAPDTKNQQSVQSSTQNINPVLAPAEEKETKPETAKVVDLIHIRVDDDKYFILSNEEGKDSKEISLNDIIKQVKTAKGNKAGIRIQIKVLKSARYLTENELKDALADAGIPTAAIAIAKE